MNLAVDSENLAVDSEQAAVRKAQMRKAQVRKAPACWERPAGRAEAEARTKKTVKLWNLAPCRGP